MKKIKGKRSIPLPAIKRNDLQTSKKKERAQKHPEDKGSEVSRPSKSPEEDEKDNDDTSDYELIAMMEEFNNSKESRKKRDLQEKLQEIHERIKLALGNVGMESNLHCTASEILKNSPVLSGGYDAKEQRQKIIHQQSMKAMIAEFLEKCDRRKSIMLDIRSWMDSTVPKEGKDLPTPKEILESEEELETIHENIVEALQNAQDASAQLKTIGLKLISETPVVYQTEWATESYSEESVAPTTPPLVKFPMSTAPVVSRKDDRDVLDEEALLANTTNWQGASHDVRAALEESLRHVRGTQIKNDIRYALKQFKMMTSAMIKRCADLKKMDEELLNLGMKMKQVRNSLKRMEEDNTKLKLKNNAMDGQMAKLEREMLRIQEDKKSQHCDMRNTIDRKNAEIEELKKKLSHKPKPQVTVVTQIQKPPEDSVSGEVHKAVKEELLKVEKKLEIKEDHIHSLELRLEEEKDKVSILNDSIQNVEQMAKEKSLLQAKLGGEMKFKMKSLNDEKDILEKQIEQLKHELTCKNELIEHQELRLADMREDVTNVWNAAGEFAGQMGLPFANNGLKDLKEARKSSLPHGDEVKRAVQRAKQDFTNELNRLKDHLEKEKQRKEADIRRMDIGHKDQLMNIHKESIHILRAINRFKDSVAQILERENLADAAHEIRSMNNLITDENPIDARALLSQMAGSAVEMLVSLEFKLSQSLINKRLEIKENTLARTFAAKDLEYQVEVANRAKQMSEVMGEKFRGVKERLAGSERLLSGIREQENSRYQALAERYDNVMTQYKTLQKDLLKLQKESSSSMKNKDSTMKSMLQQKQNFEKMVQSQEEIIMKMRRNISKKCKDKEEKFKLSLHNQRENLERLEKAFREKNLSNKMYSMTVDVIRKTQQLPILRLRHLMQKYLAHRRLKDAKDNLEKRLSSESCLASEKRHEIMVYMSKVDKKIEQCTSEWQDEIQNIEGHRKQLFEEMSDMFGDILILNGLALNMSQQSTKLRPPCHPRATKKAEYSIILPPVQEKGALVTVGTGLPVTDQSTKESYWEAPDASKLKMRILSDTPRVMDMDINASIRGAKRGLARQRQVMKISHADSVEYSTTEALNFPYTPSVENS